MAFYGYTAIPQDYSYAARVGEGLGKLGAAVAGGVGEHKALKALRDDVAVKRDLIAEDLVNNAGFEADAARGAAERRIVMLPGSDSKTERERVAKAWESALKFVEEQRTKHTQQTAHQNILNDWAPAPPENPAVDRMFDRAHQPQEAQSSLIEPRPSERLLQGRPFPSISESAARDVKDVAAPSKLSARSPADAADGFLAQSKQSAWGQAPSPGRLAPSTVTRDVADFANSVARDVDDPTPSSHGILPFMRRPRSVEEMEAAYAKEMPGLSSGSQRYLEGVLERKYKKEEKKKDYEQSRAGKKQDRIDDFDDWYKKFLMMEEYKSRDKEDAHLRAKELLQIKGGIQKALRNAGVRAAAEKNALSYYARFTNSMDKAAKLNREITKIKQALNVEEPRRRRALQEAGVETGVDKDANDWLTELNKDLETAKTDARALFDKIDQIDSGLADGLWGVVERWPDEE